MTARSNPFLGFLLLVLLLPGCSRQETPTPEVPSTPGMGETNEPAAPVSEGDRMAPDFTVETMDGGTFHLADQRGKIVLVNFWATWCVPCIAETPDFVALFDAMKEDGLTIVGISLDEEGFDVVRPFAERFKVNYPMGLDDGTIADDFGGVYGLPTTFIIDQEGRILHRFLGIFPMRAMGPEIEALVGAL